MDPETPASTFIPISPDNSKKTSSIFCYIAQLVLRVLVIAFTLSGIITLVTSAQSVTVYGIVMDARYTYSASFRFKLIADCVVCGLSVLSVIHLILLDLSKSSQKNYFYLFLHDLVSLSVLLSGCSASLAIGYVAKFGQPQTGWLQICDRVGRFCHQLTASILLSFFAVIFLFVLTLISAHKLKS